ncbi:flagellar basal body L-ring protein FlgH [Candidatus Latescibacterota bacterium]
MKIIFIFSLLTVVSIGLKPLPAMAQDFPDEVREVSLFSDVKAFKVGDVLTVIVSESNSASKNTSTATKKQNTGQAKGEATTGALEGLFPGVGGSMDVSNQFNGQGSSSRRGEFSSRITVKVVDVTKSGNLVIEGNKSIEINEDTEVITLSGMVQPVDISASNTIYSYQIANAKLTYKGKGSISQAHRPGILVRIINWLL